MMLKGSEAVSAMPLHDVGAAGALPFTEAGHPPPDPEDPLADVRIVAPGYFATMGIPFTEGMEWSDAAIVASPWIFVGMLL